MTTWQDVKSYIDSNYQYTEIDPSFISIEFKITDELRSQVVFLRHANDSWLVVESVVGPLASIDLRKALELVSESLVGGLSVVGEVLTVRDAIPLADVSADELNGPLQAVALVADGLEKKLLGVDSR